MDVRSMCVHACLLLLLLLLLLLPPGIAQLAVARGGGTTQGQRKRGGEVIKLGWGGAHQQILGPPALSIISLTHLPGLGARDP